MIELLFNPSLSLSLSLSLFISLHFKLQRTSLHCLNFAQYFLCTFKAENSQ